MVTVTVSCAVDGEWYEGRVVRAIRESNPKCLSNLKYKALHIVRVYPRLSNSR